MKTLESFHHRIEHANATQSAPRIVLRHLILGVLASIVFTIIFIRLFDFIEDTGKVVTPFDSAIANFMFHHRTPQLTILAKFLAHLGSPPLIAGLALAAALIGLIWKRLRGAAWTLPIAIFGAALIIQGVKLLMHRPRPALFTPLLHETGYSFPSGHSLIAMVVYGLLGYFALKLFQNAAAHFIIWLLTLLIILSIGISRVYVGVHYPTDVLAGWAAGVPWLIACVGLHEVLSRRWPSVV